MNPWRYWRTRNIRNPHTSLTCRCGIAYWADSSGRRDRAFMVGHAPSEEV
jgi:hypothetical protein